MNFEKIEPKKKSQMAAEALLEMIKKGYFKPGDKLPPERVIAIEMGVSRNTLREAVAALQIIGLLEVRHSQGNFVVSPIEGENRSSILDNIFATNDDPFITIEARIAFEPGVAVSACHLATEEDIKGLEKKMNRVVDAIQSNDLNEYSQADHDFHLNIAQCTHNPIIIQMIQCVIRSLTQPLWRAMKKGLAADEFIKATRISEHEQIFQSLINRNQQEAGKLVRLHLQHSKERLLFEIENDNEASARLKFWTQAKQV